MRIAVALLAWSPLLAQTASFGVRVGIPITPVFRAEGHQQPPRPRYKIGPLIEVHLWRGAAIGADFLLSRAGLAGETARAHGVHVWRWELPVTLAYRFRMRARPFARAGIALNRMFGISGANECARGPFGEQFYCVDGAPLAELRHRGTYGPVIGGGLRFRFKGIRLEPEMRVTRWIDRNFGVRDSALRSNLNQLDALMSVVF